MSIGVTIAVFAAHDAAAGIMSALPEGRNDKPCFDAMLAASSALADAVGRGVCDRAATMYEPHGGSVQVQTKLRDQRSWWLTVAPRGAEEGDEAARRHWCAARRYAVPGRVHVMGTEALVCGDAVLRPTAYGGNHRTDSYESSKYTDEGAHDAGRVDASVAAALVADATVLLVPHGSLAVRGSSGYDLVLRHCLGAFAALRRGRQLRLHIVEIAARAADDDIRQVKNAPPPPPGKIHKTIADVLHGYVKSGLLCFATHSVNVAGAAKRLPAPSHGATKAHVGTDHPENGGWWPWLAIDGAVDGAAQPGGAGKRPYSPIVEQVAAAVVRDLAATVPLPNDNAAPTPPPAHAASTDTQTAAGDAAAGGAKTPAASAANISNSHPAFGTCPHQSYATGPHAFLTAHLAWQHAFEHVATSAAAPDDDNGDAHDSTASEGAAVAGGDECPAPAPPSAVPAVVTPAMAKRKAKGHLLATHRELADRRAYATRLVLLKTAPRGLLWFYVLQGTLRTGDALCFAADPMRTQFAVGSMRHAPAVTEGGPGGVATAYPGDIVSVCAAEQDGLKTIAADDAGTPAAPLKQLHAALREQSQWSIAGEATLEGFPAAEAYLRFMVQPMTVSRQKEWIGRSVAVTGYGGTSHGVVVASGVMANGKTGEVVIKIGHLDAKTVLVGHRHGLRTYSASWATALAKVGSGLVGPEGSSEHPPHGMVIRVENRPTSKHGLAVGKLVASFGYLEMARLFAVLGRAGPAAVDAAVPDLDARLCLWRELWSIDPAAPSHTQRNTSIVTPVTPWSEPQFTPSSSTTVPAFPVPRITGTNVVSNHQVADTFQSNMALCLLSDAHTIMENMNPNVFKCGDGKSTTLFRLVGFAFGIDAYKLALQDACCTLDLRNHRSWLPQNLPPNGSSLRMSTTKIAPGRRSLCAVKDAWTSKAWTAQLITSAFSRASVLAATTAYNSTSMPVGEYQNIVTGMIDRGDFLDALHVMAAVPNQTTQDAGFLKRLALLAPKLPDTFLYHMVIRNPTAISNAADFIGKIKWSLKSDTSWQWQHFASMEVAVRPTDTRRLSSRFVMYAYFVGTVLMAAERRLARVRRSGGGGGSETAANARAAPRAPGIAAMGHTAPADEPAWATLAQVPRGPVFSIAEMVASFIVPPRH